MKNVLFIIYISLITLINTENIDISPTVNSICSKFKAKIALPATKSSTKYPELNFNFTLVDDGGNEYQTVCEGAFEDYNYTELDCEFDPPENSTKLTYKENSVNHLYDSFLNIIFPTNFSVSFEWNEYCDIISFQKKKANCTLIFRQLNNFIQESDTISFYFYGLTTSRIEINEEIIFDIYLYLDEGEK